MKQRGRILRDTNVGPGLLNVGGKQYTFTLEDMWQSDVPPRPGMVVDVTFGTEGTPRDISVVPDTQLAKEQTEQALARALPESEPRTEAVTPAVRNYLGWLTLSAEGLMLISFFILPNLLIGNVMGRRGLTGWEAIEFNLATQAINDRGLLSSLAIVCMVAPLTVSFVRGPWRRWLYAAPLGFALLAFATVFEEIQHAGQAASQGVAAALGDAAAAQMTHEVTGMFTIGIGAYLVFLCSAYLASRTLRATS